MIECHLVNFYESMKVNGSSTLPFYLTALENRVDTPTTKILTTLFIFYFIIYLFF